MYKLDLNHRYSDVTDYIEFAQQFEELIYAQFPNVCRIDFNSANRSSSIYFQIETDIIVPEYCADGVTIFDDSATLTLKIRFSDHQEVYECDYSVDDDSSRTINDAVNFINRKINEAKNVEQTTK